MRRYRVPALMAVLLSPALALAGLTEVTFNSPQGSMTTKAIYLPLSGKPQDLLQVQVEGLQHHAAVPEQFALCNPDGNGKSQPGQNDRPTISWRNAPPITQSFAVVVTDPDVPADFTDAGQEGKVVKEDATRQLFYHWALADIPLAVSEIPGGPAGEAPPFGKPATGSLGKYVPNPVQYGGPCPPWNDERIHHYSYTVYALNVAALPLPKKPTAAQVEAAAKKAAIATATVTGTYTLNPALRK